ncbi:MAG: hypothetical protein KBG73_03435 [Candidatus Promineofilum sp.]|nr:hypothetical protein [Promineifilum sp.]
MSLTGGRFTVVGAPHGYYDRHVALESRVWRWRLPFGIVEWRRPTAVLVEDAAGYSRLPIRDVTRRAELGMIGVGFLCLIAALLAGRWASEVKE